MINDTNGAIDNLKLLDVAKPLVGARGVLVSALPTLQAVRDEARIKTGDKVLIIGASGGVGTFAVQIAGFFGAEVTGVCRAHKASLVRSIGASRVIDYEKQEVTDGGQLYDAIPDPAAALSVSDRSLLLLPRRSTVWDNFRVGAVAWIWPPNVSCLSYLTLAFWRGSF